MASATDETLDVSVVIPARNEESRIPVVLRAVRRFARQVVVVDDASNDATAAVAEREGATVVRNPTQRGYLGSVRRGFEAATKPVIVIIDADGEFDPADIPSLAGPVLRGEADLVLGARERKPRRSEAILNWLANLRVRGDSGTVFRALSRDLANALPMSGKCVCGTSLLEPYLLGARIREQPVKVLPVQKQRRIQWRHLLQIFCVLRLLIARRRPRHWKTGSTSDQCFETPQQRK